MTSNDPSLTPSNSDILWHPIISSTAVVTKNSQFPRWPSITIYLFTWGSNGEMGCLNISRDTPLPLLVLTDHWSVSESFLFFGCIFYNTNRKRFTRFPDDTLFLYMHCVSLTSVIPPSFCHHPLWCCYRPFINPPSGYVYNDNSLYIGCTGDSSHGSVTGYHVSYWPSSTTTHPSPPNAGSSQTASIII